MKASRTAGAWMFLIACLGGAPLTVRAAEPIPIATFVANPDISDAKLSPSGKFVALTIANKSGRTILAVSDVDLAKPPVVVAASSIADIRAFELLRAAGQEPEYVVYSGEGHGFLKMENRIDFYTRMEKFLAKHIGSN